MVGKKDRLGLRTWIEIDKKAISNNVTQFKRLLPKNCLFCAVVKSNAYGHGLADFSKEVATKVDYLAVDSIVEAVHLRDSGIKTPILVLGYTLPEMYKNASLNNIEITISSVEQLEFLKKVKDIKLKIHLKIDTGMHRQGFLIDDVSKCLSLLTKIKNISIVGVYTHFASAKNPAFPEHTKKQINIFEKAISMIRERGYSPIVHASATSGAIVFPNTYFDMVRIGIGLYGFWPSPEVFAYAKHKMDLKPVLSWRTIISEIKEIKEDSGVGYDMVDNVKKGTKIAICPVGYWHGYSRALSSIGEVLVCGQRARIVGRVCMDMIMIDVTKIKNIKSGDVVTIIGKDGVDKISAEYIAMIADQSYYEFLTRINPLIKKILI